MIIQTRQQAFRAGSAATGSKPQAGTIAIELPPGTQTPIAVSETPDDLTPAQSAVVAQISDDFADGIENAVTSLPEEAVPDAWDTQQTDADAQFRNLFGEATYLRHQADAAVGAMGLPVQ